jgi:beta-lactamase regulating signal transducer with metallopeptidase domain
MAWLSCIISNVVLASLVALAAWFVQRRLGRYEVARVLWLLALVKLITPPLVRVPLVELPGTIACALGVCGCVHHAGTLANAGATLPWVLLAAWSSGAAITCWTAWRRWARFQRMISLATPAPPQWQSLARRLAGEISLRRVPIILAVPGRLPPLVIPGWRRSRLLLPLSLLRQLNASQRKALLLHELVHIRRGDHWTRLLELAVAIAFWWLPIAGAIGRQLRVCEEACCDAAVVSRLPNARHDYARLLLDVVDFAHPLPSQVIPQATAMSAAKNLEERIYAILGGVNTRQRLWPALLLTMGVACVILPCRLHYDFARRSIAGQPASSVNLDGCDPFGTATTPPAVNSNETAFTAFCCPS